MGWHVSENRQTTVDTAPDAEQRPDTQQSHVDTQMWGSLAGRCLLAVVTGLVALSVADLAAEAARPWGIGPAVRVGTVVSLGMLAGWFSGRGVEFIRRDLGQVLRRRDQ
jgi:hypothetical protein